MKSLTESRTEITRSTLGSIWCIAAWHMPVQPLISQLVLALIKCSTVADTLPQMSSFYTVTFIIKRVVLFVLIYIGLPSFFFIFDVSLVNAVNMKWQGATDTQVFQTWQHDWSWSFEVHFNSSSLNLTFHTLRSMVTWLRYKFYWNDVIPTNPKFIVQMLLQTI